MSTLLLRGPRKFARETVRIADDEDVRTADANAEPAIGLRGGKMKRKLRKVKNASPKKNLRGLRLVTLD